MIGRTLSHYVLEDRLGQGGMGVVYLARDTMLGRAVAIKVISGRQAGDREPIARLLREARAASRLNHPNVVTVYEIGHADGLDFIAMEHVDGRPLSALIPPGGLPIPRVVAFAGQIVKGVAAAHAAGVVHRDLKPANVIVTPDERVKVLDFGLAREIAPVEPDASARTVTAGPATMTVAGTLLGTVGYMAPEQIEGRRADARSDVFAIGVILYEMLAGRRPFAADSPWVELGGAMAGRAPAVQELRPDTPPELARIVARCLATRPEQRYASACELGLDLAPLAARDGAGAAGSRAAVPVALLAAVGIGALAIIGWLLVREAQARWARETAPGQVERLLQQDRTGQAYLVARRALALAPRDSRVLQTWNDLTLGATVTSSPSGATVQFRNYRTADDRWVTLGVTPLRDVRVPIALLRWRLTRPGFDTLEVDQGQEPLEFRLVSAGTARPGMVLVPRGEFELEGTQQPLGLPDYWLDRTEVTNRQYQAFVAAGGYRDPRYWQVPFVANGRTLSFAEAMKRFRDTTGRPGPATWEYGGYPEGKGEDPVGGVSWYEAAAYARFAHKALPTVYHWYRAAGVNGIFSEIVEVSNFSGKGPVRVGSSGALGPFGTWDMAGNVKEWCWNGTDGGRRFILGGGWDEASYMCHDEDAQPPFERRPTFGFRCMQQDAPLAANMTADVHSLYRDFSQIRPVSDDVYRAYLRLYDYDPSPLDPKVESVDDANPAWRKERVTVRAAYGDERLPIYLLLPKSARPPYQTVVFFPGSNAVMSRSSRNLSLGLADYHVRAGRALVYPVYQGTYERGLARAGGMNQLRDVMIQRGKDVRRTVEYLMTRRDIDSTRIAYYGLSLGGQLAPLFLALEPRFRAAALFSGGFATWKLPPECDPVNFAPRVTTPVLMVNGREDFDLPYATSQVPMFRAFGTREPDKQHVVLPGGHIPAHPEQAIRVVLDWLDQRMGAVR
ncbi:MAG TPA: protein kinase [Candidatus Eisenbacteria bacterium]|nr:protein kinase [Candidatus Eisenbacteria bacterium]